MMDSVGVSFQSDPNQIEDLQFDNHTLHFTVGHLLVLVTLLWGRLGTFLRRRLEHVLTDIEVQHGAILSRATVRPHDAPDFSGYLRRLVLNS